ncbi:anaphase-promoting complex protein [Ophiocordyceps sinensis CO18]|uniref:Anaphase-promoting complex subunit 5 n=1 Tax=Ophiocordyceps sinensis (strain Co18 / CGMCC 3.14243) TaxID=911162 RepID=T5AQH8_OPHSC|nr:anaphase-promoting complex protein [Ophiocordyceps sinensis CO18]
MARYLNPAKIGLLALIELYTEEAVSNDAVLPVLSFITSHILDHGHGGSSPKSDTRWSKAERTVGLVITVKDFERLLGSYPCLTGMPGRRLWDQFLAKLWDINSLHALHSFFGRISTLLLYPEEGRRRPDDESPEQDGNVKLSRNSPFGAFIRRARLEFQRLRFHDCAELWKAFVKYRQPTAQYLRRKNPAFGRLSFDNVLLLGERDEWNQEGVAALAAVAYGDMLTGDASGTIPVSTDDIEVLLEFQIEQMQTASFLDAWRAGDYTTAFDYLHRYFDYTMEHRDRLFYQYALMNLAVLQADFGCYQEAVSAMLETVSTARENHDMTCLNFALNWLFHFGRAHPDLVRDLESNSLLGTGKESLAFLRVKAKESGMWTLWSSVLLSEAKVALINGDSVATSLEYLVRSSQIIVDRNLKSMFGSQLSLYAALWNRLGLAHLSFLTSDTFLRCHARDSVFDDELKHTCRVALALAERGKYAEGLQKLDSLDDNSLRSWKPSQYWHKCRGIIKLKKDLHHGNLDGAAQLLDQLSQSKVDDLEPDMAFLIDSMHIDYLSRRGSLQAAFEEVNRLTLKLQDENRDIAFRVKLLLLKVSLLDKCGRTQRAFSTAVRAANIAWRARLIPSLWQAIGAISNILVSLAEFDAAVQLLVAVIPRALECGVPDVAAQLYSFLADANMGLAGTMEPRSSKRTEFLTKALAAVQKAFDHYSAVEDIQHQCVAMAKKAMILKLTGELALSSDFLAAYVELRARAVVLSQGLT